MRAVTRGGVFHSVTRGVFYLSIEKGAALLSGIAYFVLLLRWMGPTKYGMLSLALSFTGLATMATANFEVYLERYATEFHHRGQFRTLRRAMLLVLALKSTLAAIAAATLTALAPTLATQFDMPELRTVLPILAWTVLTDGLYMAGRSTLYGVQQFKLLSFIAIGFHVVKTVMVGAMWGLHWGLVELCVGLTVITIAQAILQFVIPLAMLRDARDATPASDAPPFGPREMLRQLVTYCAPLLGARLTFTSGANLGKVVIGKLFTATELGYFSFAYQTIERFVELMQTLPASALPAFTRLEAEGARDRLDQFAVQAHRVIQVLAAFTSLAIFAFAREITLFGGSPLFEPAIPLLRLLALVPFVRTAQQPLTMAFQALRQPGTVLRLEVLKFAIEFGCYFALVPVLGIGGPVCANLVAAVVSYVAALASLAVALPGGARARAANALRVAVVYVPLVLLAWIVSASHLPLATSVALRAAVVVAGAATVFLFGLVVREDVERFADIPLESAWMRRAQAIAVGVGYQLTGARRWGRTS